MGSKGAELATAALDRMNVDAAAQYVGLSASTLNKLRTQGKGPRYLRLSRRVMYRRQDLDQYVENGLVETTDSREVA